MLPPNQRVRPTLRQRLADDHPIVGTMVQLNCCEIVEMAGVAGYDYVVLDAEHGALDVGALTHLIRAADAVGIAAMVRVPDCNAAFIQRVLDAGADGILVPRVRDPQRLAAAVRSAHFAPRGDRGSCSTSRAAGHWAAQWAAHVGSEAANPLVWALVEDPEGMTWINEIASAPGLDALVFGAFDLAQCLGVAGEVSHSRVKENFDAILASAREHKLELVSIIGAEPEGAAGAARRGARILLDGFDSQIISSAYRERLRKLREALTP